MNNIRAEKECVMELIKENKPIVEINLKMAKKHIKLKGIKKASKKKKSTTNNISTFFEIFIEEAYKQLRLDAKALAKDKIERKESSLFKNMDTKANKEDSTSIDSTLNNNNLEKSTQDKYSKKINNSKKSNLLTSDNSIKKDVGINKESLLDFGVDFKNDSISKPKTLNCPPKVDNSKNSELDISFMETKRIDGTSQIGFSISTIEIPIEKTKRKKCKKLNINDNNKDVISQLSFFSL